MAPALAVPARQTRRAQVPADSGYEPFHDLADVLGFAAIVRRRFPNDSHGTRTERAARMVLRTSDARLPMNYMRHVALDGADLQESYFNAHRQNIDLVGPLPDGAAVDSFDLPAHLLDPYTGSGARRTHHDQVFHIHCHHDAKAVETDDDSDPTSRLVLRDRPVFEVTFEELRETLSDPARLDVTVHRPLVFLNMCRGDFDPGSSQSISKLLIRNGNRGVVSTSVKVPDTVAARFAQLFYENLLYTSGSTVGTALRYAKVCSTHVAGRS